MIQLRDKKDNNKQFPVKPRPKKANLGKLKQRELEESLKCHHFQAPPNKKYKCCFCNLQS